MIKRKAWGATDMAITLDEFRKLKTKVEERKAKAARAEGAYDEAMKRLKAAGHESIEAAEKGLAQLRAEEAEAEQAYEEELARFKLKWEGKLGCPTAPRSIS
jgi:hypothetical protein